MSRLPGAGAHPPTSGDRTRKSAAESKSLSSKAAGRTEHGMEVSLEIVIRRVTEEVVRELARQGIRIDADGSCERTRTERGGVSPLSPDNTARNSAAGVAGLSSEASGRTERGGVSPLSPDNTARNNATGVAGLSSEASGRTERVDMTGYRTPVLLERHISRLHALTGVVAVPKGTVISPKAREELKDRNILLYMEE